MRNTWIKTLAHNWILCVRSRSQKCLNRWSACRTCSRKSGSTCSARSSVPQSRDDVCISNYYTMRLCEYIDSWYVSALQQLHTSSASLWAPLLLYVYWLLRLPAAYLLVRCIDQYTWLDRFRTVLSSSTASSSRPRVFRIETLERCIYPAVVFWHSCEHLRSASLWTISHLQVNTS